jgi:hypothetical protein
LDLLNFTSNPTLEDKVSVLVPGVSDHDGIPVVVMNTKPRYTKMKPRKVYKYDKADIDGLKKDLKEWSTTFTEDTSKPTSVNDMFSQFQKAITTAMDKYIPSKMITKRNQCPWLNKKVKRLHKRKQRAFNSHKRNRSDDSYENFKKIRKETTKETRKVFRKHVKSICSGSLKKFYSYIKSLKVDSIGIPSLKQDGRLLSDNQSKAKILNDQFKSVFTCENTISPHLYPPQISP